MHRDLFTFLGSASRAFTHHFQTALQNVGLGGPLSALGPAVIVFHETRHTRPLQPSNIFEKKFFCCVYCCFLIIYVKLFEFLALTESPEDVLRNRFAEMKLEMEAFSSLRYIGVQTKSLETNFSELKQAVKRELENTTVRSPRQPAIVFQTLKVN